MIAQTLLPSWVSSKVQLVFDLGSFSFENLYRCSEDIRNIGDAANDVD